MANISQAKAWIARYQKFASWLYNIILSLAMIDFIIMIISVSIAVVGRYVFHSSPSWTEEIGILCLIYLGFLSSSLAIKDGKHIRMNIIDYILPEKWCKILHIVAYVVLLILSIILINLGYQSILLTKIPKLPATHFSMAFKYGIVFICAIFNVFMAISRLLQGEW